MWAYIDEKERVQQMQEKGQQNALTYYKKPFL